MTAALNILTTPQGYVDALALIGELHAGTLTPATLALAAPYPSLDDPDGLLELADPPMNDSTELLGPQRTGLPDGPPDDEPRCERCSETVGPHDDTRYAPFCSIGCKTAAEIAMRRARAVALLGEPRLPLRCDGVQDEHGRSICEGNHIARVTFVRERGGEPRLANWCYECRCAAEALDGALIEKVEDAA